jgi:hypothetical protein
MDSGEGVVVWLMSVRSVSSERPAPQPLLGLPSAFALGHTPRAIVITSH